MNLFNIFSRNQEERIIHDSYKTMHIDSIEELINSISHHDNHTLAVALYKAAQLINLIDPLQEFIVSDKDLAKQDRSEVTELTQLFVDMAQNNYLENKESIDRAFANHLN